MNSEIKTKWVEALRSGEYEQGQARLCRDGRFCCLGVLCEVLEIPWKDIDRNGFMVRNYVFSAGDISSTSLPYTTEDELDFDRISINVLIGMNDSGDYDFNGIADYIEEKL